MLSSAWIFDSTLLLVAITRRVLLENPMNDSVFHIGLFISAWDDCPISFAFSLLPTALIRLDLALFQAHLSAKTVAENRLWKAKSSLIVHWQQKN